MAEKKASGWSLLFFLGIFFAFLFLFNYSDTEKGGITPITYQKYLKYLDYGLLTNVSVYEPCGFATASVTYKNMGISVSVFLPNPKEQINHLREKHVTHTLFPGQPSYVLLCKDPVTDIDYDYFLNSLRNGNVFGELIQKETDIGFEGILLGRMKEGEIEYKFRVNTTDPDGIIVDTSYLGEIRTWNKEHPKNQITIKTFVLRINGTKNFKGKFFLYGGVALGIIISLAFTILIKFVKRLKKQRFPPENSEKDMIIIQALQEGSSETLKKHGVEIIEEPKGEDVKRHKFVVVFFQIKNYLRTRFHSWFKEPRE